jgi:hypothetical protein
VYLNSPNFIYFTRAKRFRRVAFAFLDEIRGIGLKISFKSSESVYIRGITFGSSVIVGALEGIEGTV